MLRALAVVLVLGSIPAALSGCTPPSWPAHGALTDRQFMVALALARQEVKAHFTTVVSATATVGAGKVTATDASTGHPCTSGTLLHITVLGEFHGMVNLGGSRMPQHIPGTPDEAVYLTADPETGVACVAGVQYTGASADPAATVLFIG